MLYYLQRSCFFMLPGCGGHPEGMDELRYLTGEEEARVIEIALDTEESRAAQDNYDSYTASMGWATIKWNEKSDMPVMERASYKL
jgi:hypothetical protein